MSTPEAQYAKLAETHLQNPRVSTGRMLKSEALRVANKSYAYLSEDGLVVKLPEPTVTGLVEQGQAQALIIGARVMREWAVIPPSEADNWDALMDEALAFVGG